MSGWQETCVRVCSRAIDRSASATSRRSWRPWATSSTRRTLSWLVIVICFVFKTPAAYLPSQLLNLTLDAIARFKGFIEISTRRGRIVTTSFLLHSLTRLPVLSDTLCQTHTHTHTHAHYLTYRGDGQRREQEVQFAGELQCRRRRRLRTNGFPRLSPS